MKLKHLFLAALAVGALASCSDDGNGPEIPEMKQVDTYLSITATAKNKTVTKAGEPVTPGEDEVGSKGEDFINTLTAYVFYENTKALAGMKTVSATDGKSVTQIEDIVVKVDAQEAGEISKTKLVVFLLANVKPESEPTDLDDFKTNCFFKGISNYTYSGVNATTQTQYLPMSSDMLEVTDLIAGTAYHNWVEKGIVGEKITYVNESGKILDRGTNGWIPGDDYKVLNDIALTRYVARIQLEELQTNFTNNYEDAEFTLTKVSVVNASNASMLYSESSFGLKKVLGAGDAGVYDQTNAFYRGFPETIDRADYFIASGSTSDGLIHDYTEENITISNNAPLVFKGAEDVTSGVEASNTEMPCFYVFEFNNYAIGQDAAPKEGDILSDGKTKAVYTTLIITGKWKNGVIEGERSFRIPVRYSTTDTDGDKGYGVQRNYIYKIHATLTGEGTDYPDKNMLNAYLSFSIKVEPWEVIKQTEDDVN